MPRQALMGLCIGHRPLCTGASTTVAGSWPAHRVTCTLCRQRWERRTLWGDRREADRKWSRVPTTQGAWGPEAGALEQGTPG